MEQDPVCGMAVAPERAKAKVEYGGKTYYFCSEGCAQKFQQTPEKHLAGGAGGAGQAMPVKIADASMQISGQLDKPGIALPIVGSAPRVKDPVCGMMVDPRKAAGKW